MVIASTGAVWLLLLPELCGHCFYWSCVVVASTGAVWLLLLLELRGCCCVVVASMVSSPLDHTKHITLHHLANLITPPLTQSLGEAFSHASV